MKIMCKSEKEKEWVRDGTDINYCINDYENFSVEFKQEGFYYSLTFSYTFKYSDDKVYFAYSQPYTYSDLKNDLNNLNKQLTKKISSKRIIGAKLRPYTL